MNEDTSVVMYRTRTLVSHAENGYSLWEFTGHQWDLRKDASIAGATPGKPPRGAGLFAGQIRSIPSIAQ